MRWFCNRPCKLPLLDLPLQASLLLSLTMCALPANHHVAASLTRLAAAAREVGLELMPTLPRWHRRILPWA